MAIVDAGYYSEDNIKALFANKIAFLTRLVSNRVLYKTLINEHIDNVRKIENLRTVNGRLVYVKKIPVSLCGNAAFAYVAVDYQRSHDEFTKYLPGALEDKVDSEEIERNIKKMGSFILISSEDVAEREILPLYYTRQTIEQIFDISKNNVDLLPLRSHSEATFRGHLMITFMTSVLYLLINRELHKIKSNVVDACTTMQNLKCKIFRTKALVQEPTKRMKRIATALNIPIPATFLVN